MPRRAATSSLTDRADLSARLMQRPRTLTVRETARELRMASSTLYKSINEGTCDLAHFRIGSRIFISAADLDRRLA